MSSVLSYGVEVDIVPVRKNSHSGRRQRCSAARAATDTGKNIAQVKRKRQSSPTLRKAEQLIRRMPRPPLCAVN